MKKKEKEDTGAGKGKAFEWTGHRVRRFLACRTRDRLLSLADSLCLAGCIMADLAEVEERPRYYRLSDHLCVRQSVGRPAGRPVGI